nr:hypothetical protein [uncultured Sphingosinicella sp.]
MDDLPPAYLAEIGRQIGFISAFLGGIAATFMTALLAMRVPGRIGGWAVVCSAAAAAAFMISVVASTALVNVLNPLAPATVKAAAKISEARMLTFLPFLLGMYLLLACLGLAGWLRSRRTGYVTAGVAGAAMLLVTMVL